MLFPVDPDRIAELLRSAPKPITFKTLLAKTRLDAIALQSALETAAANSAAFRWPDHGASKQRFWHQSADECAKQAVLDVAARQAISRGELIKRARKLGPGFSDALLARAVSNLAAEGQLRSVPSFTSGKLLMKSGASEAYAAGARAFLARKFEKAGIDLGVLLAAAPDPTPKHSAVPERILEAMRHLDPGAFEQGYPVSAWKLRRALPESQARIRHGALELIAAASLPRSASRPAQPLRRRARRPD
ncbi:MAG: hypothetical protein U0Q16_34905 [Bryobacteraceae bacterium]